MPMSPPALSSAIKSKVAANNPTLAAFWGEENMDWLFDSIAEAVVEHIIANMEVVTVVENTPAGVSPAETYLAGTGASTSIT